MISIILLLYSVIIWSMIKRNVKTNWWCFFNINKSGSHPLFTNFILFFFNEFTGCCNVQKCMPNEEMIDIDWSEFYIYLIIYYYSQKSNVKFWLKFKFISLEVTYQNRITHILNYFREKLSSYFFPSYCLPII